MDVKGQVGQATENQQGAEGSAGEAQSASTEELSLETAVGGDVAGVETDEGSSAAAGDDGDAGQEADPKLAKLFDQLTKGTRGNKDLVKALSKFQTLDDLSLGYLELSKKLGTMVPVPGKDATPEEITAYRKHLGIPESAEKYSVYSEKDPNSKELADFAFKAGLNDEQAKALKSWAKESFEGFVAQKRTADLNRAKETDSALKKEYGEKYQENLKHLQRAVSVFGGPEAGKILKQSGLLFNLPVAEMFIKIGQQIAESGAGDGHGGGDKIPKNWNQGGGFNYKEK